MLRAAFARYVEKWFDLAKSERQIKQLVMGRKAWRFAGSENGARNSAILLSLIVSFKLGCVDPSSTDHRYRQSAAVLSRRLQRVVRYVWSRVMMARFSAQENKEGPPASDRGRASICDCL